MYRRWIGTFILGVLVVGVTPAPRTVAEVKKPVAKPDKLPADLDFVFESGGSFITLRPDDLLAAAPIKQMPPRMKQKLTREMEQAQKFLGVALADVERLTLIMPVTMDSEPVMVVRTHKAYDRDALIQTILGDGFRRAKYKGFNLFTTRASDQSLCAIDGHTFAVGRGRGMKETITQIDGRSTPRPHSQAIEWAAAKHQVVLGGTAEPILGYWMWRSPSRIERSIASDEIELSREQAERLRRQAEEAREQLRREMERQKGFEKKAPPKPLEPLPPPPIKEKQSRRVLTLPEEQFVSYQADLRIEERRDLPDFNEILDEIPPAALPYKPLLKAKSIAAALDLGEESKLELQLVFDDEDAAKDGEVAARVGLYVLREALGRLPHEMRVSEEMAPKVTALVRDLQASLRAVALQRRGSVIDGSLSVKTDEATLKPVFAEMEKAAANVERLNNLKQIGLAMHMHHDATGMLPAAALCDKAGKPLLSWRVAILPYIEQENLYSQFKLDEPWDSAHNIKLLDKMPPQLALPGRDSKKGETHFRIFTGPNTPFNPMNLPPGKGPSLITFIDGMSNTLLVVEAADAVPWTKPDDLAIDPKKPLPKLGGSTPDGFLAVFADGSVCLIPKKIDEKILRNLIDPADGNEILWEQIEPRRGRPIRKPIEGPRPIDSGKPAPPEPERKP